MAHDPVADPPDTFAKTSHQLGEGRSIGTFTSGLEGQLLVALTCLGQRFHHTGSPRPGPTRTNTSNRELILCCRRPESRHTISAGKRSKVTQGVPVKRVTGNRSRRKISRNLSSSRTASAVVSISMCADMESLRGVDPRWRNGSGQPGVSDPANGRVTHRSRPARALYWWKLAGPPPRCFTESGFCQWPVPRRAICRARGNCINCRAAAEQGSRAGRGQAWRKSLPSASREFLASSRRVMSLPTFRPAARMRWWTSSIVC